MFCRQLRDFLSTLVLPDCLTSGLMLVEPTFITVGPAIGTIAVSTALFETFGTFLRHDNHS